MKELEVLREIHRQQARRFVGISPYGPRLYSAQAQNAARDAEYLALPVKPADPIQEADGTFIVMPGYSVLDGPDHLA